MANFRMAVLCIAALFAATTGGLAQSDPAQSYPNQIVRIVVPFSAGSITDTLARILADKLTDIWKQQVIVENRPGIAGTASVAKSAPDGYTLMVTSNGHTVAAIVNKNLPYDPAKDFVGVTGIALIPHVMIIPPDLSVKTLKEFIALAREKPGKLNFSSAGLASTSYLGGELFKQAAKIDMVHIPHRGAPEAATSVMRNESQLFLYGISQGAELHKAGKVHAMAIATAKRSPALPDVPTATESGLPYVYDAWFAMLAPANVPQPILNKVRRDIARILQTPELAERLTRQGMEIVFQTSDAFDKILKSDVENNSKTLRAAGVGGN